MGKTKKNEHCPDCVQLFCYRSLNETFAKKLWKEKGML
jgi:hypothetical protein